MNKYEVLYILENDLADETKQQLVDKFSNLIATLGGTVTSLDVWGSKEFKYTINYKKFGYYVLMNFTAAPTVPQELERAMKITDGVIRYMVIRKPETKQA